MNWLLQIFSIIVFNLRSLPERKGSAISAAVGIAGVVAVLVGVLSIAEGFKSVMNSAASPDTAIVLRTGSDNEMNSGLTREDLRIVRDAPGVAKNGDTALASGELLVIVDRPKRTTGTDANVPLRGVEPTAFDVRGNVKIIEGRRFETGKNEVVVGSGAGALLGATLLFFAPEAIGAVVDKGHKLLFGVLMVLAVIYRPRGLVSIIQDIVRPRAKTAATTDTVG